MNIFKIFKRKNKKETTVSKQANFDKKNKLSVQDNSQLKDYTFEEAFEEVFNRTPLTRAKKPKDIEQFKTEMILYSVSKLSPDTIINKYNFSGRSFFTMNIVWGFFLYGFEFRTDHMRQKGVMPKWVKDKMKK